MAIEFQINLGGNFVEALEKSSKKLGEHEKKTHDAEKALELFEGELGKVKAGALQLNFSAFQEGGHFLQFDLAEGAALAFEAIHKVAEAVVDLGKEMIRAAANAEDLNLAVKLDVGDEGAEKVDQLTESFKGTRFSPDAIKEALLPILEESGTEHQGQWDALTTAATDVATRRNTGIAGAKAALEALNEIELNPQRLRGSLKALGIKQVEFYQDLGQLMGISAKTAAAQTKAGQIKAQTLLSVALHQIAAREGGALGNATNEGSKTLGASLERLANLKDELFKRLAGSEGLKTMQSALDAFVDTVEGPLGTELIGEIDQAFGTLFGDFAGPDGAKKVGDALRVVADEAKGFIRSFREAWPEIKQGAADLWEVLKAVAKTVAFIAHGYEQIAELTREISNGHVARDIGDTITGNHGGITGDRASDKSPIWKVVREAGVTPPPQDGGFVIPKLASGGIVDRPTLALIGEAGPEAVVPLSRGIVSLDAVGSGSPSDAGAAIAAGGRGDVTITIGDIIVQGGGSGDKHEIAREVRIEVKRVLDEAAAAFGAAA